MVKGIGENNYQFFRNEKFVKGRWAKMTFGGCKNE